jgi:hypothetical protein
MGVGRWFAKWSPGGGAVRAGRSLFFSFPPGGPLTEGSSLLFLLGRALQEGDPLSQVSNLTHECERSERAAQRHLYMPWNPQRDRVY